VDAHLPALARCANGLERDFVLLCERYGLPIPEPNERIGRYRPDMLWRGSRLIVELDGRRAHSTPAQLAADARRQSELEALGYCVVRFTAAEARESPDRIAAVIGQLLA
jgi:very-short-patch-repair endonuclease